MEYKLYRVEVNQHNIGPVLSTPNALNPTRMTPLQEPSIRCVLSNLIQASIIRDVSLFTVCNEAVSKNGFLANILPGIWEVMMEYARPINIKKKRTDCAFFFTRIEDARNYQDNYPGMKNGVLCEVSIVDQEFMKECDMAWLDDIDEKSIKASEAIDQFKHYWAGELTSHPVIEVLFSEKYQLTKINDDGGQN